MGPLNYKTVLAVILGLKSIYTDLLSVKGSFKGEDVDICDKTMNLIKQNLESIASSTNDENVSTFSALQCSDF